MDVASVRPMRPCRAIALLLAIAACRIESPPRTASPRSPVANLHAFARLYGVLRWFHPSDAAAVIDWDRFAAFGARRVMAAADRADPAALRAVLQDLIAPFAPTVQLAGGGERFAPLPTPEPASNHLDVVAWQHKGYGDSTLVSVYASKRSHRPRTVFGTQR